MPNLLAVNIRDSIIVSLICHIRENFSTIQDSVFVHYSVNSKKKKKFVFTYQTHLFIIVLNVLFGQHVSTLY
jgi:hypothetical protein